MSSTLVTNAVRFTSHNRGVAVVVLLAAMLLLGTMPAYAQAVNSGSDGSDGAYNPSGQPGTVITFDPSQFHGSQVSANIFNFTTITIPTGVTLKFSGNTVNGPIYWLAQGDVDIEGTLDLTGAKGADASSQAFFRVPAVPGSGGYAGGVGGVGTQAALPGAGVGGGTIDGIGQGRGGTFGGNHFLIPLVGGSGGGGGKNVQNNGVFDAGGGAGGGAIMIASSTRIVVNGNIGADGGNHGTAITRCGGGGSGGAIRLVANALGGSGSLTVRGGTGPCGGVFNGGDGVIREESISTFFQGTTRGIVNQSTPFRLLLPTAGSPSAIVISINGTPITPNPNTFPDITVNTGAPVPVVIQTQNIPANAAIALTILDENNVADTVIQAPPLSNCTSANVCTTTVDITFPFGGSFGLTKVTWTVQ